MAVSHTVLFFVGLGGLWLGLVLHIVGTGTRKWVTRKRDDPDPFQYEVPYNIGLFSYCGYDGCRYQDFEGTGDKHLAMICLCLAGIALSAVGGVIALMMATCMRFRPSSTRNMFAVTVITSCLIAGGMILIAVILFGEEVHSSNADNEDFIWYVDYSFALCVVGAILIGTGGALVFACRNIRSDPEQGSQVTCAYPLQTMYLPQTMGGMSYQPQQQPQFVLQHQPFVLQPQQNVLQQQQIAPQQQQIATQQQQNVPQQQQNVLQPQQIEPQPQQIAPQQQQIEPQQQQNVLQQQQNVLY